MTGILVVEDDPSVSRLVTLVLQAEGYEVRAARDGLEALHEVEREEPDLVVLDLAMPHIDGRTFVGLTRRMGLSFRIVILSAYGASRAAEELCCEAGVEKPFDPERLTETVERLLRS